jgi:hypothetical protein
MADKSSGGVDALSDLWWFIGIMVVLGALWIAGGGAARYGNNAPPPVVASPVSRPSESEVEPRYRGSTSLANYRQVQISRGNASSAYQSSREYIILTAGYSNSAPVSITGWTLTNSQGQKLAIQNKRFVEQSSARVAIPTGALIFDPAGRHIQSPIILNPGDRAYVITGSGQSFGDYPIKTSFKVNKCSGYLETQNDYKLEPPLSGNQCPDPETEVALASLPDQCYDFVRGLARCHIPKVSENRDGDRTVDGRTGVPKICVDFVLPYLDYGACVRRHINDRDFLSKEWRIYLGQRWEMWADKRETITLSDASGNIIDQLTY